MPFESSRPLASSRAAASAAQVSTRKIVGSAVAIGGVTLYSLAKALSSAAPAKPQIASLSKPGALADAERALAPTERETFRAAFREIDADGSGKIDEAEMLAAVRGAGRADATASEIATLFKVTLDRASVAARERMAAWRVRISVSRMDRRL